MGKNALKNQVIKMRHTQITPQKAIKCLGIYFGMNFRAHIDYACKRRTSQQQNEIN